MDLVGSIAHVVIIEEERLHLNRVLRTRPYWPAFTCIVGYGVAQVELAGRNIFGPVGRRCRQAQFKARNKHLALRHRNYPFNGYPIIAPSGVNYLSINII